jgi:hypothetical protein
LQLSDYQDMKATIANRSKANSVVKAPSFPYLTWKQLQKEHPDRWVLLVNADSLPMGYAVKGGQVVASADTQEEALAQAHQLPKGSRMSVVFTGKRGLPDNVILCL